MRKSIFALVAFAAGVSVVGCSSFKKQEPVEVAPAAVAAPIAAVAAPVAAVAAPVAAVAAPVAAVAAPVEANVSAHQLEEHKKNFSKHKGKRGKRHHFSGSGNIAAGVQHPVHGNIYAFKTVPACKAYCRKHHHHVKAADPKYYHELLHDCREECKHHHKTAQSAFQIKGVGQRPANVK